MPSPPKTRGNKPTIKERYPLGEFPPEVITSIGRQITHQLATGRPDITGDDFGSIFADAIGGQHAQKPEGVADVVWNGCAWSVKTVKLPHTSNLHKQQNVRLISGRNSPKFSSDISDPLLDPEQTGESILKIWNKRRLQALKDSDSLRVVVLLRQVEHLKYLLFEEELNSFTPGNYKWTINARENLEGREIAANNRHTFTWQPHGSQFTIIRPIPSSAVLFCIKRPPTISRAQVLKEIGYDDTWVTNLGSRKNNP